jgi:uncharacterized protein (DUF433 family)
MPSTVVSLRVSEEQAERLQRKARQLGRTSSETGAILLEESLRRDEFGFIDFRDSAVGRQAFIQGTRLAVWMIVKTARGFSGNVEQTAKHFERSPLQIQAALNYAKAFPDEIEAAIKDHDSYDFAKVSQMLPHARLFEVTGRKPAKK